MPSLTVEDPDKVRARQRRLRTKRQSEGFRQVVMWVHDTDRERVQNYVSRLYRKALKTYGSD